LLARIPLLSSVPFVGGVRFPSFLLLETGNLSLQFQAFRSSQVARFGVAGAVVGRLFHFTRPLIAGEYLSASLGPFLNIKS
jgi:hypothetical protein